MKSKRRLSILVCAVFVFMYVLNSCNSIITNNTMKQNKTDTVEIKQMAFFRRL